MTMSLVFGLTDRWNCINEKSEEEYSPWSNPTKEILCNTISYVRICGQPNVNNKTRRNQRKEDKNGSDE